MLPEVRVARIVEAIGRYGSGRLSCLETATLGMSERHFTPLHGIVDDLSEGAEGLIDRRTTAEPLVGIFQWTGLPWLLELPDALL